MGMGYGASYAETVSEKFVKKMAPKEYKTFMKAIEKTNTALEEFATSAQFDDFSGTEISQPPIDAFVLLQMAFKKATRLDLSLGYHSEDEGDRYDEVSGVFWTVDGVWKRTSAGEKFKKQIERKFFVTFG